MGSAQCLAAAKDYGCNYAGSEFEVVENETQVTKQISFLTDHSKYDILPPSQYDYSQTTEDYYGVPHFSGKNADIRPLLDYTYHRKYSPEREEIQDRLIDRICCANFRSTKTTMFERERGDIPWVIFTAGAMGAGKGYAIGWMDEQKYLPLGSFVTIDPDQVRSLLPEWNGYVERDAERAGDMTQKEAGHIAEIAGYKALRSRKNVIFDGSLRDTRWYIQYLANLRRKFPGIRIMILHVTAEREEILKRAEERGRATGRHVPRETLVASIEAVPVSVQALAPYADFVCRVRNSTGMEPKLEREPGAPHPPDTCELSWGLVQKLWRPLDVDGDGELSKEEIDAAIASGILTKEVVETLDTDGDHMISKAEFDKAKEVALNSGTRKFR